MEEGAGFEAEKFSKEMGEVLNKNQIIVPLMSPRVNQTQVLQKRYGMQNCNKY